MRIYFNTSAFVKYYGKPEFEKSVIVGDRANEVGERWVKRGIFNFYHDDILYENLPI